MFCLSPVTLGMLLLMIAGVMVYFVLPLQVIIIDELKGITMLLNKANPRWVLQAVLMLCLFADNANGASRSSSSTSSSVEVRKNDKKQQDLHLQQITGLIPGLISIVRKYTGGYNTVVPVGLQRSSIVIPKFGPVDLWQHSFNLGNGLILFATRTHAIVLAPSATDSSPVNINKLESSKKLPFHSDAVSIDGCAPLPGHADTYVLFFAQASTRGGEYNYFMVFSLTPKPNTNCHVILDVNVLANFCTPRTRRDGIHYGCKMFETGPYAGCIAVPVNGFDYAIDIYDILGALKEIQDGSHSCQTRQSLISLAPRKSISCSKKHNKQIIPLKEDNRFLVESEGLFEIYDSKNDFRESTHAFGTKTPPRPGLTSLPLITDHEGNILFVNGNNELIKYDASNGKKLMQQQLLDLQNPVNHYIEQILMLQDGNCFLATSDRLMLYDLATQRIIDPIHCCLSGLPVAQLADGRIAACVSGEVLLFEGSPTG